ncbi:hypothetical protein GDO78_021785 [Eleutherodactylus coqui]|uniref:Uncharacterized protein n=1 Tax=Eleutherodactylus coqui TaxID=57060 RepID=A0A8J6BIM1_ELECQ|nr:hypothetical protein GDO78_021785 [Eleutherodactylus coqui]
MNVRSTTNTSKQSKGRSKMWSPGADRSQNQADNRYQQKVLGQDKGIGIQGQAEIRRTSGNRLDRRGGAGRG